MDFKFKFKTLHIEYFNVITNEIQIQLAGPTKLTPETTPFVWHCRQKETERERETEIRIWIVYKTINEHIYFMFMLIFFFEFDKTQHKNFSFRFVFMLMSGWGGGGSQGCSVAGSGWLDRQLITIIDGGNYHHRSS